MSASIEQTLQTLISSLAAVQALGTVQIRPYRLEQKDISPSDFGGVLIEVLEADDQHVDLDARGGTVSAKVHVTSVATTFLNAWALAEAIRVNGTNPGTGLVGYSGTPAGGALIQKISADGRVRGFEFWEDGSPDGYFYVRQPYDIDHLETA